MIFVDVAACRSAVAYTDLCLVVMSLLLDQLYIDLCLVLMSLLLYQLYIVFGIDVAASWSG